MGAADTTASALDRVRVAERRRAVALAQLAERESQLAALHQRVQAAEQATLDTAQRLRAQVRNSEARCAAAELESAQAAARSGATEAELAAAHEAHDARHADLRQAIDAAQVRAASAERERDATFAQGAADRARLLAQIARLEQQLARSETQRDAEAAHADVELLVAELTRAGDELEAARREIAELTQAAARERAGPSPAAAPLRATTAASADAAVAAASPELAEAERQLLRLRDERDALERAGRAGRGEHVARIRELEQLVSTLSLTLAATRDDVDRAERSRAWRLGHGVSRAAARAALRPDKTGGALAAALRRIEEVQNATRTLPAAAQTRLPAVIAPAPVLLDEPVELAAGEVAAQRRLLAAEIRLRLGAPPQLDVWPAVSIIVPSRNGREHLQRLLDGLRDATDYPELELVVVDNGSEDATIAWLDSLADVPVSHVANAENVSYSHANMQGAELAIHPLLLFLNNDVQPFEPGWLREMVASHRLGGHAITGATLLHTERSRRSADGCLVQHRAIRLRRAPTGVQPYNDGDGAALFGPGFGVEQRALAVSGACLMIDATTLEQLGGWSSRYRYGSEDVDLALRAGRAGLPVATTGRAVLYHEESATRIAEGPDFSRATRETNRRALQEMWGPQLRRAYQQARLTGDTVCADGAGPHVAITVTSLAAQDGWGDWYTAHELGEALRELGWRVQLMAVGRGDTAAPVPAGVDYVITLLDRFDARLVPAEVGVIAWIRNWTDRWLEHPWFERLDVVLASSRASAELIEQRTGLRPILFPLATNAARFAGARPDPARAVDCVFTGNHWGRDRAVQAGLAPSRGQTLAIHGKGWEKVKPLARHHVGVAAYEDLPEVYASAKLVLDDTQEPTLRYDAVNARVFDALAAGSLVLTNCATGVRELFDDTFPVWSTPEELRVQRDGLLADPERRADAGRPLPRDRAHAPHLRAQGTPARRGAARTRGAAVVLHQDRRAGLGAGSALGRSALRARRRARAAPARAPLSHPGARGVGERGGPGPRRRPAPQGPQPPSPAAGAVQRAVVHQPPVGADRGGVRRLRPRRDRLRAVRRAHARADDDAGHRARAGDRPAGLLPRPAPRPGARTTIVVYVANSRNVLRPMMRDLLPTDLDLAVYGANWDGLIDMKYVVAEHVPNDELRRIYSSAKVVLADHWDDMREHGFVSNRIYDALACGAVVVSDDVVGLAGRFGGAVRTVRACRPAARRGGGGPLGRGRVEALAGCRRLRRPRKRLAACDPRAERMKAGIRSRSWPAGNSKRFHCPPTTHTTGTQFRLRKTHCAPTATPSGWSGLVRRRTPTSAGEPCLTVPGASRSTLGRSTAIPCARRQILILTTHTSSLWTVAEQSTSWATCTTTSCATSSHPPVASTSGRPATCPTWRATESRTRRSCVTRMARFSSSIVRASPRTATSICRGVRRMLGTGSTPE